jgi:hypothetical protein
VDWVSCGTPPASGKRISCLVLAIGAGVLAACTAVETVDRPPLEQTENGFRYHAEANASYPADDPQAENMRLQFLDEAVTASLLCPNGYDIIDRKLVLKERVLGANLYDIYYTGRCRS